VSRDPPSTDSGDVSHTTATTRSGQLASVAVQTKTISSFIAAQPAEHLRHYLRCLQLVSRGLASGKVRLMIDCLRRLTDDSSADETSPVAPVSGDFVTFLSLLSLFYQMYLL